MNMRIAIKGNAYFYGALILLVLPLQWAIAWLIAAAVHELGHYLAVRLCGGEVYHLTVGIGGAVMDSSPLPNKYRLFCILGGPAAGFSLVCLGRLFPRLALCGWVLTVFNLLPILPMDGGRALQILLKDKPSFYWLEKVFLFFLFVVAVYMAFCLSVGLLPVMIAVVIWIKYRNIPCKRSACAVQ